MAKTPTFSVPSLKDRLNRRIKEVEDERDDKVSDWFAEAKAIKKDALAEAKRQIADFDPKASAHVLKTDGNRSSGRKDNLVWISLPSVPYLSDYDNELTLLRSKLSLLEMVDGTGVELTGPFKDLERVIAGNHRRY